MFVYFVPDESFLYQSEIERFTKGRDLVCVNVQLPLTHFFTSSFPSPSISRFLSAMEAVLDARSDTFVRTNVMPDIDSNIPTPFPIHALRFSQVSAQPKVEPLREMVNSKPLNTVTPVETTTPIVDTQTPSGSVESLNPVPVDVSVFFMNLSHGTNIRSLQKEVLPSLLQIQQSCLTTLNNLFSYQNISWQQIVPTRRHSLPAPSPVTTSNLTSPLDTSNSSALHTLLNNLRSQDTTQDAPLIQLDDESPAQELLRRVSSLSASLSDPEDAQLAQSLVSLMSNIHLLSDIQPSHSIPFDRRAASLVPTPTHDPFADGAEVSLLGSSVYDTLSQRVISLQSRRSEERATEANALDDRAAEKKVLWSEVDRGLETVLRLCRQRTQSRNLSAGLPHTLSPYAQESTSEDHLPPEYDPADYVEPESSKPPEYDPFKDPYDIHHVRPSPRSNVRHDPPLDATSEKMRLDLEGVASAIDRLYMVAPQLNNQRVELKKSKLQEMESARRTGSADSSSSDPFSLVGRGQAGEQSTRARLTRRFASGSSVDMKGKGKSKDVLDEDEKAKRAELDRMVELIGKTSGENRRIDDQRVEFGDLQARLQRSKAREDKQVCSYLMFM